MHFAIRHETRYDFAAPVRLNAHRIMVRPRDGHDLRLVDASLTLSPPAPVVWSFDVFGNSIGTIRFDAETDRLAITSEIELERFVRHPLDIDVEGEAGHYPPIYHAEERRDLAPLLLIEDETAADAVSGWIGSAGIRKAGSSLDVAAALMSAIHGGFRYEARYAEGTQSPADTLASGSGTCRDFAFLMMEAGRALGFAARFATGYLYSPALDQGQGQGQEQRGAATIGAAATHAWAELFLPGIGWTDYDPTNNIVNGADLIKVAVVRKPSQAVPVAGTFTGPPGVGVDMTVNVTVDRRG